MATKKGGSKKISYSEPKGYMPKSAMTILNKGTKSNKSKKK